MLKNNFFLLFTLILVAFSQLSMAMVGGTSYKTIIEVEDWGAVVSKLVVDLGSDNMVDESVISTDTFKVFVLNFQEDGKSLVSEIDNKEVQQYTYTSSDKGGEREITKVYVSDAQGNRVFKSNYVTLELVIGPSDTLGLALYNPGRGSKWGVSKYTITQEKSIKIGNKKVSGLNITKSNGTIKLLVDDFKLASYTDKKEGKTLSYAHFSPKVDNKKNPLIIWLHGMGEGGVDATIPLAGNKASIFASDEVQEYFDGAYVLQPQATTFWMHGITGGFGDGTSMYEVTLMNLIKDYVSSNSDIDTDRIYVGGISNGGYMTMLLLRDYPDYFAAALVACEALKDELITDEQLDKMKDIPIWFAHAKSDPLVKPEEHVVPTFKRYKEAGAKDVHLSLYDRIEDQTGLYNKEDGTPYEYMGHFSWIPLYNNELVTTVNNKEISAMEWLASQKKK